MNAIALDETGHALDSNMLIDLLGSSDHASELQAMPRGDWCVESCACFGRKTSPNHTSSHNRQRMGEPHD